MIDVRRLDDETVLPQTGQREKKRRRIGTAGNGSDQPARAEPALGEELANGRVEHVHFHEYVAAAALQMQPGADEPRRNVVALPTQQRKSRESGNAAIIAPSPFMAIAKGVLLGPYEILNQIGEGGMGEVWRARDKRIGRDVAVKVLPESFTQGDERILRFEQEARAAGALNHPGLVTIFDVGTTDGAPYIVMELLEGETLRDAVGDTFPVPLPVRKAVDYATQAASALAWLTRRHRPSRSQPENLFITSDPA